MSEYVLKHSGEELDIAIERVLSGYVKLSDILLHCTRYASGSYTPLNDTFIGDISIPVSNGSASLKPKVFIMFHNSRIENSDESVTKFALTSSVTVTDNDGTVVYSHSSGIYHNSTLKSCSNQSGGRYFQSVDTGVSGVGTNYYLQGGKQYLWFAWG